MENNNTATLEEKGIGIECKDYMVKELAADFTKDKNFLITGYMGLTAGDLNELRASLRKLSSQYLVVKNSSIKRALKEAKMDEISPLIEGGVGIAFGGQDPVNTIKALVDFAKSHDKLSLKNGYLDGKIIDKDTIQRLSAIPSRKALLAKFVWLVNSPVTGFVNVLAATLRSLLYALNAYKDKKEKEG